MFNSSGNPNPVERLTFPCPKICPPELIMKVIISRKKYNGFNMFLKIMRFW